MENNNCFPGGSFFKLLHGLTQTLSDENDFYCDVHYHATLVLSSVKRFALEVVINRHKGNSEMSS